MSCTGLEGGVLLDGYGMSCSCEHYRCRERLGHVASPGASRTRRVASLRMP